MKNFESDFWTLKINITIELFKNTFEINPENVSSQFQIELIDFQCYGTSKSKFQYITHKGFYKQIY